MGRRQQRPAVRCWMVTDAESRLHLLHHMRRCRAASSGGRLLRSGHAFKTPATPPPQALADPAPFPPTAAAAAVVERLAVTFGARCDH